jgi:uncharacterized cupredoxin-like copper-binding protein
LTAPSPPPGVVGVSLSEFMLAVAPGNAAAGRVTFQLANIGATKHDFVVLGPTGLPADILPSDDGGETVDEWETGFRGAHRGVQAGEVVAFDIALAAGHYVLICNLPDHYSAGMRADFEVH